MVPYNQLDPDQRQFLSTYKSINKNAWLVGFPGSGKSVLLLHYAKKILDDNPNASIVFVVFTQAMVELFKTGLNEIGIGHQPVITYYNFYKGDDSYDYIFCDEIQDFTEKMINAVRSRGKIVIAAGDSNQCIYEKDPRFREATVSAEGPGILLGANKVELSIIHRLSKSIISAIQKLLPMINIWQSKTDATKADVNIRLCKAESVNKEVGFIYSKIEEALNVKETCAILLPRHEIIVDFVNHLLESLGKQKWSESMNSYGKPNYKMLNMHLKFNNVRLMYVGNGYGSLSNAEDDEQAVIMTYHSSKGLDFDNVFIPFANEDLYISANDYLSKTVFMVAMSRCKKNLYITHTSFRVSCYVQPFADKCSKINISDNSNEEGNPGDWTNLPF
jgi:superfamily I DNA/RNA helicase